MTNLPNLVQSADLDDTALLELYEEPGNPPWVRANFVVSVDGAVATVGSSSGLTSPFDQRVLKVLRDLSDVVLVGASTIRVEDYIGIRPTEAGKKWRLEHGLAAVPPIAVVTGRADIDPESRLLTNTLVPPIILTTTSATPSKKQLLRDAGAQVIELGEDSISSRAILDTLAELGMNRIVCEGGPILTGQLVADDVLDELCVTTSPKLLAGESPRITRSNQHVAVDMRCRHIIFDTDGAQLARWIRQPS
ncbi:pyrimidine reductase family protein [Nocardia asiatica]|uniref:pyrimidine reductase family protein n=1 Tax=Nocardia asiatica TaxID=209252 RepID=UPI0024572EC4|nr:pyrimidine reductase family protein [Nocardia asiatica]